MSSSRSCVAGVVVAGLACVAGSVADARGDVVEIVASRDGTLYQDSAGSTANGAGQFLFVGRVLSGFNANRRALLRFDLSAVPSGATITDVSLRMTMSRSTSGATDVSLHRVVQNWGEGTSAATGGEGGGTAAAAGDATWIHTFSPGSTWTNAGGDFDATAMTSVSVDGTGVYTWPSSAAFVAAASAWAADASNNFGVLLLGDETVDGTSKRFNSRENVGATTRPTLVVTYSVCRADFNGDGFLDFTDFDDFVTAFEAGSANADFNGDGFLDFTDFDAFVGAFEGGC